MRCKLICVLAAIGAGAVNLAPATGAPARRRTRARRAADRRTQHRPRCALVPQAYVGSLQQCRNLWIITQADHTRPAHEVGSPMDPGPQFWNSYAFAATHDLGFPLWERWQFSLVQVIRAGG